MLLSLEALTLDLVEVISFEVVSVDLVKVMTSLEEASLDSV